MNWPEFRATKLFDLLMGVPLIAWFGWNVVQLRATMAVDARLILADPSDLYHWLRFSSLTAAVAFNLLLIWQLLVRSPPVAKSRGLLPRLAALVGTFLGVSVVHLKPAMLPFPWLVISTMLTFAGGALSAMVLARLGKAFAIMPEARRLVTAGPYAYARHPLYAVEMITQIGIAMQFEQPWAGLLTAAVLVLQVTRSIFEEQVLSETYPEYESYRARTARFIPGVI
jgi:protein-S-isoprenylcysteine O-methyltransferase Ste14